MKVAKTVSKAEFARLAGVSTSSISRNLKTKFAGAVVGNRIDISHPDAARYLEHRAGLAVGEKGTAMVPTGAAARKEAKKTAPPKSIAEIPEDIAAFQNMTLRELIDRFGTATAFCDWLRASKTIEDIAEKRIKNAASAGDLVSRRAVKVGVIDVIESAHIKLLTDGSKTIATRVFSMIKAGREKSDIVELIEDQIGSFIRPIKARTRRCLREI
jgi:hypothetical protein